MFSDWGSGFWIGKMAVELLLKKESFLRVALFNTENIEEIRRKIKKVLSQSREDMIRKISSFSRTVIKVAELGDDDGIYIINLAIRELMNMCLKVREMCGVDKVALHGGLFKNRFFRENFINLASRYYFYIVGYNFDGARGAAKFTMASGGRM